jgi:PQQ-dependent dehydrogenase (methanol/ethanol family)
MLNLLPIKSTPLNSHMSKCAIALICCAFLIEPLFAQELDWPNYGNDQGNMRYQNIDQINPSNVNQLAKAWVFHTGVYASAHPRLTMEMTPIIQNGVMYVTSGIDDVYALNPTTGAQTWHYNPASDMLPLSSYSICCGLDNRGVAVGGGMVFDARLDSNLVALNQKTGAVVWKTLVDNYKNGSAMTLAPQYVVNNAGQAEVLVGVTGGEYGIRGHLDAYAAATGKLLWRFWTTTPATYAGTSWQHGGAPIWGTPTFDPALNMVYFSTGNAFPWTWAGNRAGTNLFSASVVALDATTGELQWFFQEAHHDQWDYDGPQPTMLITYNGVPALEHTNKTGYTFILDRASGEPLIPYQEVPIPPDITGGGAFQNSWPTQPESSMATFVAHIADADSLPPGVVAAPMWTTVGPKPVVFAIDGGGGMEWPPAAYSPRTGFWYSHEHYSPSYTGTNNDPVNNLFCPTGLDGTTKVATCDTPTGLAHLPGVNHGAFGALNLAASSVAWTVPILTTGPDSGMTVAGDLVFFGDVSGLFYAASAATGEILWVFDAFTVPNAGGAGGSAAVYEINGVEYVVYGFGNATYISDADAVIAFALPATVKAAAARSLAGRARVK